MKMQQMREHQPCGASSYNSDLCAYFHQVMGLGRDLALFDEACQLVRSRLASKVLN
jgi:hypothetical protein